MTKQQEEKNLKFCSGNRTLNPPFITSEFHRLAVRNHSDPKLTFCEIITIPLGHASSGQGSSQVGARGGGLALCL